MADLFPDAPRRPRRVMMHVVDAGNGNGGRIVQMKCTRRGYDTGWIEAARTVTEDKRGMPCPDCNPEHSNA